MGVFPKSLRFSPQVALEQQQLAFSQDGTKLLTLSKREYAKAGKLHCWNLESWKDGAPESTSWPLGNDWTHFRSISFLPDGSCSGISSGGDIYISSPLKDSRSMRPSQFSDSVNVSLGSYSRDGSMVAIRARSLDTIIVDLSQSFLDSTYALHLEGKSIPSPVGTRLKSSRGISSNIEIATRREFVVAPFIKRVQLWDVRTGALRSKIMPPVTTTLKGVQVSSAESILAVSTGNGLHFYDLESESQTLHVRTLCHSKPGFFSPDDLLYFNQTPDQGPIEVWDYRSSSQVCSPIYPPGERWTGFHIQPLTGKMVATSSTSKTQPMEIHIWDIRNLKLVAKLADIDFQSAGSMGSDAGSTSSDYIFDLLWDTLNHNQSRRTDVATLRAMDWTGMISKESQFPSGVGRFGEVFKGKWVRTTHSLPAPPDLAIKVPRFSVMPQARDRQEKCWRIFEREVRTWHGLRHENILRFVGLAGGFGTLPALISIWMDNGNLKEYLQRYPQCDLHRITVGIACGLQYLHSCRPEITHGDLKADNVLVNQNGTPCLADFGLSRMMEDHEIWATTATSAPGTVRWMAPELLEGAQLTVTTFSDVYAFAMTIYEVYTLQVPFNTYRMDGAVITAVVIRNERPQRPVDERFSNDTWEIMNRCWARDVVERPDMSTVLSLLHSEGGRNESESF